MWLLIAAFIALVIWLAGKWLAYYFATEGLLYYLATEHDELLDVDKVRELQQTALRKTIQDWFGKT